MQTQAPELELPLACLPGTAAPRRGAAAGFPGEPSLPIASIPAASTVTHRFADYLELSKPRMNFLVLVTTAVGYFMAGGGARLLADRLLLLHTLLGSALAAAGASVLNQYLERHFDALMLRTRNRPLPAGRIGAGEALLLGLFVGTLGVLELGFFVNWLTGALAAFTLLSYVLAYTPMKRRTTLCTIVGAVPGAIPIMMGWTAVRNGIGPEAIVLFGILFLWQMPHFLAIAILYRDDYARGGFRMLPVVDSQPHLRSTGRQIVMYAVALLPITLLPVRLGMAGPVYFVAAAVLGLGFIGFGVMCALTPRRPQARQLFLASITYLPMLLGAMMIDKI
ncbi:MAG TPA: heme o synthase [Tepidisphaeraceae bacterium]|jgi:protoheme IX farnesyltransferase|nr:heme o synthase [Tepidisphaeraceae bacterium]